MSLYYAQKAAKRGATALDKLCGKVGIIPCDWREKIDRNSLDMSRGESCILGQTCDDYDIALDAIQEALDFPSLDRESWAEVNGFQERTGNDLRTLYTYEELDQAWRELLAETADTKEV